MEPKLIQLQFLYYYVHIGCNSHRIPPWRGLQNLICNNEPRCRHEIGEKVAVECFYVTILSYAWRDWGKARRTLRRPVRDECSSGFKIRRATVTKLDAQTWTSVMASHTDCATRTATRFFSEFLGFHLSVTFHRGSPCSCIIWWMNNRSQFIDIVSLTQSSWTTIE
jgi:hypothetical protein